MLTTKGGGAPAPTTPAAFTAPKTTETTETTPAAPTVSEASVESVLSRYQSDYSGEDAEGLRGLFSAQLSRTDGSKPTEDLNESIATYEQQFSELTDPRYTLSGISIETREGAATAHANYSISSQNGTVTGAIEFGLVEEGGQLLIDTIRVTPSK